MLNSTTIYIICTPDYIPIVAFTNEQKAKEYMVREMLDKGTENKLEYVNLEIDEIFLKRMEVLAISVRKNGGK